MDEAESRGNFAAFGDAVTFPAMTLVDAFYERFRGETADTDRSALESSLEAALFAARAAWPEVALDESQFARALGENADPETAPENGLLALHATDLYLARACANGDTAALRALEAGIFADVPAAIRSIVKSSAALDEAMQRVRASLLVAGDGAPPKIAEYAGRGSLHGWVRVVAVRVALMMVRRPRPEVPLESALLDMPAGGDAELDYLRKRYGTEFKEAFAEAFAKLSAEERTLLELTVLEGVSLDRIGAMHRVNKSTVSRWLSKARETLLTETRRVMKERLRCSDKELESLLGLVRSQLDVSLERLLREG